MTRDLPGIHDLIRLLEGDAADPSGVPDTSTVGGQLRAAADDRRRRMRQEAALFRRVLWDSPDGRRLLELFYEMAVASTAWDIGAAQNMETLAAAGIWHEAQRRFVLAMIEAIRFDQTARDEDDDDD